MLLSIRWNISPYAFDYYLYIYLYKTVNGVFNYYWVILKFYLKYNLITKLEKKNKNKIK